MSLALEKQAILVPQSLALEVIAWGYMFLYKKTDKRFIKINNISIGINKKNKNAFYVSDGKNYSIFMDFEFFWFLKNIQDDTYSSKLIVTSKADFIVFERVDGVLHIKGNNNQRAFNENEERRINFLLSKALISNLVRSFKFKNISFDVSDGNDIYTIRWNGCSYPLKTKDAFKLMILTGGIYS